MRSYIGTVVDVQNAFIYIIIIIIIIIMFFKQSWQNAATIT